MLSRSLLAEVATALLVTVRVDHCWNEGLYTVSLFGVRNVMCQYFSVPGDPGGSSW